MRPPGSVVKRRWRSRSTGPECRPAHASKVMAVLGSGRSHRTVPSVTRPQTGLRRLNRVAHSSSRFSRNCSCKQRFLVLKTFFLFLSRNKYIFFEYDLYKKYKSSLVLGNVRFGRQSEWLAT
jgi:hypothetical protein